LDYCAAAVGTEGSSSQRMNFFGTLALLRCAASSPAAAVVALNSRAGLGEEEAESEGMDRLFDGGTDALPDDDVEPPIGREDPELLALIAQAKALTGQGGDPKLKKLTEHVGKLLEDGYAPVIFCRYIATAHYLGRHLQERFKQATVAVVTGDFTAEERREKVGILGEAERRILVATDCLSEGINLQDSFDAVVHYDLSWNPTRHEQREGRVDRFGQRRERVRATLMYGANNPVDGAVLEVILRKAERIREELGVPVPLPDVGHTLTQALLKAILLRRGGTQSQEQRQIALPFAELAEAKVLETKWADAAEKAKRNRTIFAQRRLRPEDVLPEWHRTLAAVGGQDAVFRFVNRALQRLGSGLEPLRRGYKAALAPLPEDLRERLDAEGFVDPLRLDFENPPAEHCRPVHRSHPLVAALAETLLQRSLGAAEAEAELGVLGRVGCWITEGVQVKTVVVLLRVRHRLTVQRARTETVMLVEEATGLTWTGSEAILTAEGE
ncbi:MAG TPA: helicase-related protein, partial [Myxococcota bacterium]|nr:helicase-related protein [Myxococcota bacterium]